MKILWITNTLFPEASKKITGKGESRGSGGWMLASAEVLSRQENIYLFVATTSPLVKQLEVVEGNRIIYYVLPHGKGNIVYNKEYELYWQQIKDLVNPDVVHIHGTEYSHGLAYVRACGNERIVVSIQGLKSGIAPYYCAGLSRRDIYGNLTFHDIIKGTIYSEQRAFFRSGQLEMEMLQSVNHIIGRTAWDRAHAWAINPHANYYVCNETLRPEFYDEVKWSYDKCVPHTIFLSQGNYPLKGLHQVIKAMPLILRHYPDATIRIAGQDITKDQGLWGLLHFTGYGKIIKRLMKKWQIEDKITFLGPLNAEQMKNEYLRANVFVCPSSIENSPNSLGEAQLLGVPCIASYVGGIPDMMQGSEENLYRFEETAMLAEKICNVFGGGAMNHLSYMAKERHNGYNNTLQLISIYKLL